MFFCDVLLWCGAFLTWCASIYQVHVELRVICGMAVAAGQRPGSADVCILLAWRGVDAISSMHE